MPAVLSMVGFGCRNATRDRITTVSGTLVYDTTNLPGGSASTTSLGGNGIQIRRPWFDDPNASLFEPGTDEFWYHFRYYTELNNTSNDFLRVGVISNTGEFITISAEDNTNLIVLRVAGVVRATAAVAAFGSSQWSRVHVHVAGTNTGDVISVYTDGDLVTPVLTYTLIAGDQTALGGVGTGKPNGWMVNMKSGDTNSRVDDLVAWDPQDSEFPGIEFFQACSVHEAVFNANGTEQDAAGSFADIDERPASDADKITFSATAQTSAFTTANVSEPNVFAVAVKARVMRTGTAAGSFLTLRIGEGAGALAAGATVDAPGDGDVEHIFQNSADGTDWSPTKRNATRFGFTSA